MFFNIQKSSLFSLKPGVVWINNNLYIAYRSQIPQSFYFWCECLFFVHSLIITISRKKNDKTYELDILHSG